MWLVRILIVFFSASIIVTPPPKSKEDYYRALAVFTLAMTYDFYKEYVEAKEKGKRRYSLIIGACIFYSIFFVFIGVGGLFGAVSLSDNFGEVIIFPDFLNWTISRFNISCLLFIYPALIAIQNMLPVDGKEQKEVST